jgi:hypothetical protein
MGRQRTFVYPTPTPTPTLPVTGRELAVHAIALGAGPGVESDTRQAVSFRP